MKYLWTYSMGATTPTTDAEPWHRLQAKHLACLRKIEAQRRVILRLAFACVLGGLGTGCFIAWLIRFGV